VLLKWFHHAAEEEVEQAQWYLHAHREGLVRAHVLVLGMYELGNVLLRSLKRSAQQTRTVLQAVFVMCGQPLRLSEDAFGAAADVASDGGLTFYDAAFAAAAREHGCTPISADGRLLATGHAIGLTESIERLRGGTAG
jgi:predicted nucleic acid-binding protein